MRCCRQGRRKTAIAIALRISKPYLYIVWYSHLQSDDIMVNGKRIKDGLNLGAFAGSELRTSVCGRTSLKLNHVQHGISTPAKINTRGD